MKEVHDRHFLARSTLSRDFVGIYRVRVGLLWSSLRDGIPTTSANTGCR